MQLKDVYKDEYVYLEEPRNFIPEDSNGKGRKPEKIEVVGEPIRIDHYMGGLNHIDWHKAKVRKTSKGWLKVKVHVVDVWVWDGKEKIADKASPVASPQRFYAFEEKTSEPIPVEKEKQPEVNYQLSRYVDFEFNSDTLSGEDRQYLDELVVLLRSDESLKVEVTGHTDHVGTRKVNENLSLQRARAVAATGFY